MAAILNFSKTLKKSPAHLYIVGMVPTLFQIQNSRTFQGPFKDLLIFFQGPFLCMLKKWFTDYKNKLRLEGMKNGNFGVLLLFLSNTRPYKSVKLQYCKKYEM